MNIQKINNGQWLTTLGNSSFSTIVNPVSNGAVLFLFAIVLFALSQNAKADSSNKSVVIGALVSAQVTQVFVKEGDQVKKGDKLLYLDSARYVAKAHLLKAQVQDAKVTMDDAKIELNQALDLFDRTVTSKRTLDASQLRFDKAKARYNQAKAELQLHQAWAKYVYIKAPMAAKITKIHTPLGSTVFKENTPMIELEPK